MKHFIIIFVLLASTLLSIELTTNNLKLEAQIEVKKNDNRISKTPALHQYHPHEAAVKEWLAPNPTWHSKYDQNNSDDSINMDQDKNDEEQADDGKEEQVNEKGNCYEDKDDDDYVKQNDEATDIERKELEVKLAREQAARWSQILMEDEEYIQANKARVEAEVAIKKTRHHNNDKKKKEYDSDSHDDKHDDRNHGYHRKDDKPHNHPYKRNRVLIGNAN